MQAPQQLETGLSLHLFLSVDPVPLTRSPCLASVEEDVPSPSPWEGGRDMITRGALPLLREGGKGRSELKLGCKVNKFKINNKGTNK